MSSAITKYTPLPYYFNRLKESNVEEKRMPDLARMERIEAAAQAAYRHYTGIARCDCSGFCLRCRELLELIGDELKKTLK